MQIPVQYSAEGAAVGAWASLLIEPNEEGCRRRVQSKEVSIFRTRVSLFGGSTAEGEPADSAVGGELQSVPF